MDVMYPKRMTTPASFPLATLEGVLERITYANDETGYTVARVTTGRDTDLLTVVGNLLGAQPGESLRMQGRWTSHPQSGRVTSGRCASIRCGSRREPCVPAAGRHVPSASCWTDTGKAHRYGQGRGIRAGRHPARWSVGRHDRSGCSLDYLDFNHAGVRHMVWLSFPLLARHDACVPAGALVQHSAARARLYEMIVMAKVATLALAIIVALGVAYGQTAHGITSISVVRTAPLNWGGGPFRTNLHPPCWPGTFHRFPPDPMSTFPWWVMICTQ
jgi:hypothetical protein